MELFKQPIKAKGSVALLEETQNTDDIAIYYARSPNTKLSWYAKKTSSNFILYLIYLTIIMTCFRLVGNYFSANSGLVMSTLFVLVILLYSLFRAAVPRRIQVGKKGIRFQWLYSWPVTFGGSSEWIGWNGIENISLRNVSNGKQYVEISMPNDKFIEAFRHLFTDYCALPLQLIGIAKCSKTRTNIVLDVDGIFHEPDKIKLYSALTHFASSEQLDPSMAALQPLGYTRVWLREFSKTDSHNNLIDPLTAGTKLADGGFEVLKQLGSGGQSLTYTAKVLKSDDNLVLPVANTSDDGHVAVLKEFVLPVRAGIEIKRRALRHIENEARLLQGFDHPQIVKYIDSFVSNKRAYLVLEYVSGISLRKLIQTRGPLKEEETIRIALKMCSILEYIHGLIPPIIHRDFTPENLLLKEDNNVVLIDFNVAQQQETTSTGTFVGKHNYFPPEQFRGNATTQSDIYACGCCIYWLCTGQDPSPLSTARPRNVNLTISEKLDNIVAKATALSLSERYATVQELKQDLSSLS